MRNYLCANNWIFVKTLNYTKRQRMCIVRREAAKKFLSCPLPSKKQPPKFVLMALVLPLRNIFFAASLKHGKIETNHGKKIHFIFFPLIIILQ